MFTIDLEIDGDFRPVGTCPTMARALRRARRKIDRIPQAHCHIYDDRKTRRYAAEIVTNFRGTVETIDIHGPHQFGRSMVMPLNPNADILRERQNPALDAAPDRRDDCDLCESGPQHCWDDLESEGGFSYCADCWDKIISRKQA